MKKQCLNRIFSNFGLNKNHLQNQQEKDTKNATKLLPSQVKQSQKYIMKP